jgi:hypothetical protein
LNLNDFVEVAHDAAENAYDLVYKQLEDAGLNTEFLFAYSVLTNFLSLNERRLEDYEDAYNAFVAIWGKRESKPTKKAKGK